MKDVEIYLSYTADIQLWAIYLVILSLVFLVITSIHYMNRFFAYKALSEELEEIRINNKKEISRKETLIKGYQQELYELRKIATKPNIKNTAKVGKSEPKPRGENGHFRAKD